MKKSTFMNKVSRSVYRIGGQLQKHSPEILIAFGIIGTVTSTVMACKATTKIGDILEEKNETIKKIRETAAEAEKTDGVEFSEKEVKKLVTATYARTSLKLAKLYAPSVALGILSITGMVSSNNILRKRNFALAAAYATVDKTFKEYRGRVVERFGEQTDKELRYNIKTQTIEENVVDENGKEKKVKKTVEVSALNNYSEFARYFDNNNPYWDKDHEYNMTFLTMEQNYMNDRLRAKGRVFLNEVYERLGFEPTQQGQVIGWTYSENNPNGDNFIDFGIFETHRNAEKDFVNGIENVILLDFNCDGDVWSNM